MAGGGGRMPMPSSVIWAHGRSWGWALPPPQAHAWSPHLPLLYCTSFYIYLSIWSIHPKYRRKLYINCNLLHCNSLMTGFPWWFSLPSPSLWTAHQLKRILFQVRQRVSACPDWLITYDGLHVLRCHAETSLSQKFRTSCDLVSISQDLAGLCPGSWALGRASVISGPCGAWRRAHGKVGDWKVVWRSPNAHKCLSVNCTCMYVYISVCIYIYICMYMYIYIYIYLYLYIHIYIYIMYACVCVCQLKMQKIHRSFYLPMYLPMYI